MCHTREEKFDNTYKSSIILEIIAITQADIVMIHIVSVIYYTMHLMKFQ